MDGCCDLAHSIKIPSRLLHRRRTTLASGNSRYILGRVYQMAWPRTTALVRLPLHAATASGMGPQSQRGSTEHEENLRNFQQPLSRIRARELHSNNADAGHSNSNPSENFETATKLHRQGTSRITTRRNSRPIRFFHITGESR